MKRFLILGACIVLCSSHAARAVVLNIVNSGGDSSILGTITVTRTAGISGYDKVDYYLSSVTGLASGGIIIVDGMWTPSTGNMRVSSGLNSANNGGVPDWGAESSKGGTRDPNTSFVNRSFGVGILAGVPALPAGPWPLTGPHPNRATLTGGHYYSLPDENGTLLPVELWKRTSTVAWDSTNGYSDGSTTDNVSSYLRGVWAQSSPLLPSGTNGAANRLAEFIVSTGASVSFDHGTTSLFGQLGFSGGGGTSFDVTLVPVPEPGTLVLLATGLLGVPAYAWRRRA